MPTYKALMKAGITGDNGMLQAFPPNTGVGWYTMATGTYPGEHGSTNNTYFRAGDAFSNRTSFSAPGTMQADTIANSAERAGKKVAQIDWVGGAAAGIAGPIVDFTNFFSNRGVLVGVANPVEQAGSAFFGVDYQVATLVPAAGWTGVPTGDPAAPPMETTWAVPSTFAAQNPNRTYNVYFYDSVVGGGANYDHAIVSPVGKTGRRRRSTSKVGDFEPIKLMGANGLIGTRANQTAGHYVKLISLAPNVSHFKLYDTSLDAAIATLRRGLHRPPGRWRRRGQAREVHRRQPAAMGGRRLRAARGRRRRRGHVRRAGPRPRAGLQPRRSSTTSSERSSRTPTSRWSAIRSPTRCSTSSWRSSRRPTPTARRTRATTSTRSSTTSSAPAAARPGASRSARATSAAATRTPTRSSSIARDSWAATRPRSPAPTTASRRSATRSTRTPC